MANTDIEELEKRLADLKSRLPAHSISARMIVELEELEDEIERAKQLTTKI